MHYCVVQREFLWPRSTKWLQTLIFQIHIIRNSLYIKPSLCFCIFFYFYIFDKTGNFIVFCLIAWNWLVSFPFNAMHIYITDIKVQCTIFYHCTSVEAYLLWKCCWVCSHNEYLLKVWNRIFYCLWHLNDRKCRTLCNKCSKCVNIWNGSSNDSFQQPPGLISISRAPRGPVTLGPGIWLPIGFFTNSLQECQYCQLYFDSANRKD